MNYKYMNLEKFRKCDIFNPIGAAINTAGNVYSNERNITAQYNENKRNRDWQSSEAEKSRNWSSAEWNRQFDAQRNEWQRQFEEQRRAWYGQQDYTYQKNWEQFLREADYNSPKNQASRMMAAGLNPSAMFNNNGGSGLVSAATGNLANAPSSSAPAPSVPTGGAISGAMASPVGSNVGHFENPFQGLGELVRNFSEAAKNNATAQAQADALRSSALLSLAQAAGQELTNAGIQMDNFIKSKTKDAKIQREWTDLVFAYGAVLKQGAETDNTIMDTALKQSEKFLTDLKGKISGEEYLQACMMTSHFEALLKSKINMQNASAVSSRASAQYFGALTATEDQIREFKVNNMKLLNDFQTSENKIASNKATLSDLLLDHEYQTQLTELANRAIQAGLVTKEHEEALRRAQKENRWYEVRQLLIPITQQWMDYQKTMSSFGFGVSK